MAGAGRSYRRRPERFFFLRGEGGGAFCGPPFPASAAAFFPSLPPSARAPSPFAFAVAPSLRGFVRALRPPPPALAPAAFAPVALPLSALPPALALAPAFVPLALAAPAFAPPRFPPAFVPPPPRAPPRPPPERSRPSPRS